MTFTGSFVFTPTNPLSGQSVKFTGSSNVADNTFWAWDFGDPTSTDNKSTEQNPTHIFKTAGVYTVTLHGGGTDNFPPVTKQVTVTADPNPSSVPVSSFTFSPDTIELGQSIQFTDTSNEHATSWSWSYIIGGVTEASSTLQNPVYVPKTTGTYTIQLIATNSKGSNTSQQTLKVNPKDHVPFYKKTWFIVTMVILAFVIIIVIAIIIFFFARSRQKSLSNYNIKK